MGKMTDQLFGEKGINLSPEQLQQFHTYYQLLMQWNQTMNLTAVTDEAAVYKKHFYDSLTLHEVYDVTRPLSICDIGSGAGFPSIPLKIVYPHLQVTIVDALQKRTMFLQALTQSLGLSDVRIYHDRAELFAKNKTFREMFEVVTARAVAPLSVLNELCLPLVRCGGDFLAMKGADVTAETDEAEESIRLLGATLQQVYALNLSEDEEDRRHIIHMHKQTATPQRFPRKPGKPKKSPL